MGVEWSEDGFLVFFIFYLLLPAPAAIERCDCEQRLLILFPKHAPSKPVEATSIFAFGRRPNFPQIDFIDFCSVQGVNRQAFRVFLGSAPGLI
jgi:hypothetical protein